ncbi:hypothetical protein K504DRAFT_431399 [Pleomassaria siparia CBS 279.74]|uniref:Zn(2)-C6 fungal-type domain-containing protein n=1 Tax=Pleomassaria siparia CBS 279.74 TaxID=1314801 RepID=A0A6G1KE54_9PLEO|nr:hypothetical protein K504DRAFT_431399 [Pleomassaria siparia CBS 279.74]
MPSMVHAPMMNSVGFMLKDKSRDVPVSAFTAVNGRTSPPSPRRTNGTNGTNSTNGTNNTNGNSSNGNSNTNSTNGNTNSNANSNANANANANVTIPETNHVRPHSRPSAEQSQDLKGPQSGRDEWNAAPRASENGQQNGHHSVSPPLSDQDRSPQSPGKRKRSSSEEENRLYQTPDGTAAPTRRRLESYAARDDSPPNPTMEHSQQRTLPSIDRVDHDRSWQQRESQDVHGSYSSAHHRDSRDMETSPDSMNPHSASQLNSDGVEMTRAGVQVDPKKARKRQFANRTKTGCGTCRRRKKKCDEAKPECINCTRGGFICEGYANKIPWPKNGPVKPHPPLQAKDRFSTDTQGHMYHNHGSSREGQPDPNTTTAGEGGRARPIVVEEHQQPTRNGWGSGWSEPPRASYPPEHQSHALAEYSHAPTPPVLARPPSNDHHAQHAPQGPPSQRQHNPRIYHHTPQTMSQVMNSSPVVTAEATLHHQSQPQSQPQPQSQTQPQQPPPPPPPPHQQLHQQLPLQQVPQQLTHQPPQQALHPSHHQQPMHQSPPAAKPPGPPPAHYVPPPPRPQKTEKEKMLSNEPFMAYHSQLYEERERCKGAIYRFNNTSNTAVEITMDERMRNFRAILAAQWVRQYRGPNPPMAGHLGTQVFVDTPFYCDYGYNISIAECVTIGAQCKFLDSGRITIGRNTEIGPSVTIDTRKVPHDSKSLKGSRGLMIAAEVHIGENVYIGANVTILAGVKIGTGAIIYPGSVVVRDVPRDVVARGNPCEVRSVHWGED